MKRWTVTLWIIGVVVGGMSIGRSADGAGALVPGTSARAVRALLDGPMRGVEQIVFATRQLNNDPHWYANLGYYAEGPQRKAYRAMGRLNLLNVRTGEVSVLLDDTAGTIRDPQVHYDGGKILFSYRRGGSEDFHLYEIDIDGRNLRQITDGPYSDIEPTYTADGGIIFVSNRCNRWVNCWLTQVAVIYRCDADGGAMRPLSSNNEHDNTPWPLPDGRILYQRWEYVDRSQVHYHHLWTMNPDGTGQMVYFGNLHPGTVMIDAKPIGRTGKVAAIFSPGHGRREHDGFITVVSPKAGPDAQGFARNITNRPVYRDVWPFSEDCFLAAQGTRLVVVDGAGRETEIYRLPKVLADAGVQCHEPRPVIRRPRERVIAPHADERRATGTVILANVYEGRNMVGVKPGDIAKLLILETLPMPIHYTGGMSPITVNGSFTLERVVGTVPVEPDGSAYIELPALRSFFFVALDSNNESVKRMQSFLTVQPGETVSCVGCHEQRTRSVTNAGRMTLQALKRPPSRIEPLAGIPEVYDFPRDIQPILDRHCVRCHNPDRWAGRVLLTGDRGPLFSHSYFMLAAHKQIADGQNLPRSNLAPRTIGAVASPLMHKIKSGHHDVKLSPQEIDRVRYWIEAGGTYPGTYAALAGGMIGDYYENKQVHQDFDWPTTRAAAAVINRRCGSCHKADRPLPRALADNRGARRHWVFNLSRPEKSLMLLAPLARSAGGHGLCRPPGPAGKGAPAVFADRNDPGYQAILAMIQAGKQRVEAETRFDMPNYRPPEPWVREMKRYGILEADVEPADVVDVYAVEDRYWRSMWYRPVSAVSRGP